MLKFLKAFHFGTRLARQSVRPVVFFGTLLEDFWQRCSGSFPSLENGDDEVFRRNGQQLLRLHRFGVIVQRKRNNPLALLTA